MNLWKSFRHAGSVPSNGDNRNRTAPAGTELLRVAELSAGYGGEAVVHSLSFSPAPGKLTVLIGPNGAGKSTVLKTLLGQLSPMSGQVLLEGQDITEMGEREIARKMAAVLTDRPRPERMCCRDLVAAGRYPYTGRLGFLTPEDRGIVRSSMELTETWELAERDFRQLSDGQRQRVLLARAVCQQPRVLVMDEPTSFLDLRHKLEFLYLLKNLVRERQVAAVLSLHELELAQRFADRLLCLRAGCLDRDGPPEQVFQGGYIRALYGVTHGDYNELLGCPEASVLPGMPEVFVVGGGGAGIPVYRLLCRLGLSFAAGVLPENDADLPVARALAAEVLTCPAYEAVTAEQAGRAAALAARCRWVVCAIEEFGQGNAENRRILQNAAAAGTLRRLEELTALVS